MVTQETLENSAIGFAPEYGYFHLSSHKRLVTEMEGFGKSHDNLISSIRGSSYPSEIGCNLKRIFRMVLPVPKCSAVIYSDWIRCVVATWLAARCWRCMLARSLGRLFCFWKRTNRCGHLLQGCILKNRLRESHFLTQEWPLLTTGSVGILAKITGTSVVRWKDSRFLHKALSVAMIHNSVPSKNQRRQAEFGLPGKGFIICFRRRKEERKADV